MELRTLLPDNVRWDIMSSRDGASVLSGRSSLRSRVDSWRQRVPDSPPSSPVSRQPSYASRRSSHNITDPIPAPPPWNPRSFTPPQPMSPTTSPRSFPMNALSVSTRSRSSYSPSIAEITETFTSELLSPATDNSPVEPESAHADQIESERSPSTNGEPNARQQPPMVSIRGHPVVDADRIFQATTPSEQDTITFAELVEVALGDLGIVIPSICCMALT